MRQMRVFDANKSVGGRRIFSLRRRAGGARKRQRLAAAVRFSLGVFRFSEVNQQQKRPKKKRFPYETAVFSSSIPLASEE
ncbi:hypothetical protein [Polaromonas sp.]|uniref:hypothetical protein n=1 Tax=Polaromonas sp. TaxID=1869339 RepID=UPI0037533522